MRRHDAEQLWQRFGAGDGSAFAQLYREHQGDVFRYCRSLLHDEEDARDAAQGTWAALWTAPGAAERNVPLRPWLFRVAHNEAISILRRRRQHDVLADLELPALDDVAGDVERRERLATLRADLVSLPERQRAALLLREVGGLGHADIGDVFGISAQAAKQTIYEARRGLVEAEGGRSMACDQVQRAISDGDGRVRRGRRLRAHLRGCASCRMFADAVGGQRDDLQVLFPAAAGVAGSAPAVVGGGMLAAGGSVATKVAVATLVVAASVGGRHAIAHAHARGDSGGGERRSAVALARTSSGPTGEGRGEPRSTMHASNSTASATTAPRQRRSKDSREASPQRATTAAAPPERVKETAAAGAEPPGQAKKAADAEPPGQAKKTAGAEPPGQAKKTAGAEPPGQAKKTADADPPGQAKKNADSEPPGQSKKNADAEPPGQAKTTADAAPPGQAKKESSSAAEPSGQAQKETAAAAVPPGQAKQETAAAAVQAPSPAKDTNNAPPADAPAGAAAPGQGQAHAAPGQSAKQG